MAGRLDREVFALALPALGALAAEPLYVLVDTAIVGHLGTTQLAALAIAATVLSTAFTPKCSTSGAPRLRSRSLRHCASRRSAWRSPA